MQECEEQARGRQRVRLGTWGRKLEIRKHRSVAARSRKKSSSEHNLQKKSNFYWIGRMGGGAIKRRRGGMCAEKGELEQEVGQIEGPEEPLLHFCRPSRPCAKLDIFTIYANVSSPL